MQTLAIIPARGGSKGVPRKNVLPLCGKPLIGWTIEAARQARRIDRVAVSTDDAEIARIAHEFGAEVVWRPEEISGDMASSEDALLHSLDHYAAAGYHADLLVFLQCTAPLTAAADVDGVVDSLLVEQADTAVAVTDFHYFLWRRVGGVAEGVNHDKSQRLLRQEREPNYLECGSVYAMRTDEFRRRRARFFGKTALFEVPAERCWEIDEPVDFDVAEVLLRRRQAARRTERIPPDVAAVIFDFDGVMTDNRVFVSQDGVESVSCNRSDGLGLARLKAAGVLVLVLSSEKNPVVAARCQKLGLPVIHGVDRKWPLLRDWLAKRGVSARQTVYVGNDLNDLECIANVGCGVAVADAYPQVISSADLVLSTAGGRGAARELADLILERLGDQHRVKTA